MDECHMNRCFGKKVRIRTAEVITIAKTDALTRKI